jgi:archaellum component FlaC
MAAVTEELRILIRAIFDSKGVRLARNQLTDIGKSFGHLTDRAEAFSKLFPVISSYQIARLNTEFNSMESQVDKVTNSLGKQRKEFKQFPMELLSIMFFGMLIQRTFTNIARVGVDTFMRVTEGTTEAGHAFNVLNAGVQTLKFAIGEALGTVLMEILPTLLEFITKIIDWVGQNKKLVGWLIIAGIVLGTLMFLIGTIGLGINGIIAAFEKLGGIKISQWIAKSGLTNLAGVLLEIVIWIVILYAAWKTNFGGIKDFTKSTLGIIGEVFALTFDFIKGAAKDLFDILIAIFEGDTEKLGNSIKRLGNRIFVSTLKIGARIILIAANIAAVTGRVMLLIGSRINSFLLDLGFKVQEFWIGVKWKIIQAVQDGINFIVGLVGGTKLTFAEGGLEKELELLEKAKKFTQKGPDFLKGLGEDITFFNTEDFKKWDEMIDANNKFNANFTEVVDKTKINVDELKKSIGTSDGEEEGILGGFLDLNTIMKEVSDTMNTTLTSSVDSSVGALLKDGEAANIAAMAQERYNRAKQGATGPIGEALRGI